MSIRMVCIIAFVLLFSLISLAQSLSPLQNRVSKSAKDLVYDSKAWTFYTGAPVRSTMLIKNDLVYFGTAKGDFYALNKKTQKVKWQFYSGYAIHSSASAANGKIFFADNKQTLYALDEITGKLQWKFEMGKKIDYPWRFDYYYSSPVVVEDKVIIGGDDGYLHLLNQKDGREKWKFKSKGVIRSTAAIFNGLVIFGDMEGTLYAVEKNNGSETWNFKTLGDGLDNRNFGFDRKGILASPVIARDKILFGGRDGILYCINANGKLVWKMDHHISWVISTVAVKDSFVVTGTSDGHFVQAVNLNTGMEMWKTQTNTLFWSSPAIAGNKVFIGGFDGNEFCLDLFTGKRISKFQTGGTILSSGVFDDNRLYVGSDDGYLYCLNGHADDRYMPDKLKRYVFYEKGVSTYFNNNSDFKIKNYLSGYKLVNSDSLITLLSGYAGEGTVVVFASDYFPKDIVSGGTNSLLRKFLDAGGRIVLTGVNPLVYKYDEKEKMPIGFNVPAADSVLGIQYAENDTRSFGGLFTSFSTGKGKEFGLPDFWTSMLEIDPGKVDIVLGKNENGFATAFIKNYNKGGKFIQVFFDPDSPAHLDAILKLSEWNIR